MTMTAETTAFLVPSQVKGHGGGTKQTGRNRHQTHKTNNARNTGKHRRIRNRNNVHQQQHQLVPSQVLKAQNPSIAASEKEEKVQPTLGSSSSSSTPKNTGTADVVEAPNINGSGASRRQKQRQRRRNHNINKKRQQRQQKHLIEFGNYPDVQWGSITLNELRCHPYYDPLPASISSNDVKCMEDVRLFEQSSWQWDALHTGRCTTSQAVAALGFLEDRAGTVLGVPKSLRRGGVGAYHRLRAPALRTLDDLQHAGFFDSNSNTDDDETSQETNTKWKSDGIWEPTPTKDDTNTNNDNENKNAYPFAARYTVPMDHSQERVRRKQQIQHISQSERFERSIRMIWGNTQEETAVLTALNYFYKLDPRIRVEEVGMCGAGHVVNQTIDNDNDNGLLIGATPDALLRHPDGTIEVIEVKNHCPFFSAKTSSSSSRPKTNVTSHHGHPHGTKNKKKTMKRFRIRSMEFRDKALPHYLPQLMLEMYCVGDNCQSAIMVRQTATNGSLVLRVHRDEEWIIEMMYWLHRFHDDFVVNGVPPPPNFFFVSSSSTRSDHKRYKRFLEWTKTLESKVTVLAHLSNDEVQRINGNSSLFLD